MMYVTERQYMEAVLRIHSDWWATGAAGLGLFGGGGAALGGIWAKAYLGPQGTCFALISDSISRSPGCKDAFGRDVTGMFVDPEFRVFFGAVLGILAGMALKALVKFVDA